MKLPIIYNQDIQLGTVHDTPYNFLVYTRLFNSFRFISADQKWWLNDLGLTENDIALGNMNSPSKLRDKKFVNYALKNPKLKVVLYQPTDPPYKVNPLMLLMNSPTIAHAYENKRYFRDEFSDLIKIPEYEIYHINELNKVTVYRELRNEFGAFVLQDEESTGSKGTYIIEDHEDYMDAITDLKRFSSGRSIVVSKYIEGESASVQVCVTKYGVFCSGVQKQLVNSKYLSNGKADGSTKWNGGEIGCEWPEIVEMRAREIATVIGAELSSHGYRGIFGVDLLITKENEVYTIEINARMTGFSQLLSDAQMANDKIPFMLLHALELGNFTYEVEDQIALPSGNAVKKPYGLMIMVNPLKEEFTQKHDIIAGIYRFKNGVYLYEKASLTVSDLKSEEQVLIICNRQKGETVGPGKRIMNIQKLGKIMSGTKLNSKTIKMLSALNKQFDLPFDY